MPCSGSLGGLCRVGPWGWHRAWRHLPQPRCFAGEVRMEGAGCRHSLAQHDGGTGVSRKKRAQGEPPYPCPLLPEHLTRPRSAQQAAWGEGGPDPP